MPNTKSAKKMMRVSERKRQQNKPVRTRARTLVTRAEQLITAGRLDEAAQVATQAESALARAAQKGVVHQNNAARRTSRLMHKLNAARVETQPQ